MSKITRCCTCMPSSLPASPNAGLELESAHMGAHLADQPVTREPMKAKPNKITHAFKTCRLASAKDCGYNELYFLVKTKLPFGRLLFLTWFATIIFYVYQGVCDPWGMGIYQKWGVSFNGGQSAKIQPFHSSQLFWDVYLHTSTRLLKSTPNLKLTFF